MPVSIGVQWPSKAEACSCERGDFQLAFCGSCGFVWNRAFDESLLEYSQRYDNSLDFSTVFQGYANDLAKRLVDKYEIRNKQVVELGCGKGHFLSLLCEQGNNGGIGFDPSYEGERFESSASSRINYVQDFYGEKYTDEQGDLVCCRHVLEHIKDPDSFITSVRHTIGDRHDTIVYFEVPNIRLILKQLSVWDIIYEHCNYFSIESLTTLFRRKGFEILNAEETYQEQFLSLETRVAKSSATTDIAVRNDLNDLAQLIRSFSAKLEARISKWSKRLAEYRAKEKRVVIWGGGAKTVSFLNMLNIDSLISHVVDINPHKQGLHLAGTGQLIVSPEFLITEKPDVVILMNPIYRSEVEAQLIDMGIQADLIEV
ncbi:class I SAM-dependent methyltransferase [Pelagicoccus mobilis]|uniref:Methyltransferase domain-containing protein n=1 Tax=Pelagicoccus mobilis TaxID=415221 RepID=A0A934VLN8_9BACT|nr:class I SAM-dependent methyltransferase [Pelagicoccus mobilis]MBK1877956.1 methyltransferase domain-containing protein [Pelagicoccus mobilis]